MTHRVEDSPFAIHNRKEIVFHLEDIANNRTLINLETSEGVSLVTSLLGVSSEANYVYVDISPDERINERIVDSKHISFATQTGIKVCWYSSHLHLVTLADGDAFSMLVPAVIERIQRREYFRLSTPQGSKALVCKIPTKNSIFEATIVDMSAGGIGLSVRGVPDECITQGAILEGCSVEFPIVGVVKMDLRVCGMWKSTMTKSGEQMHQIGMQFVNLSRSAENVIQRYMMQLQSERISLA